MPTFLNKHDPIHGAESAVFYASYVFFEKLRVKLGKPKSKKRLEMEKVWEGKKWGRRYPDMNLEGMPLKDIALKGILCRGNERPYVTQFGDVEIR